MTVILDRTRQFMSKKLVEAHGEKSGLLIRMMELNQPLSLVCLDEKITITLKPIPLNFSLITLKEISHSK